MRSIKGVITIFYEKINFNIENKKETNQGQLLLPHWMRRSSLQTATSHLDERQFIIRKDRIKNTNKNKYLYSNCFKYKDM